MTNTVVTRLLPPIERTPAWVIDAILGTLIVLGGLLTTVVPEIGGDEVYRSRDVVAVLLVLTATVPYYVRRRAPLAVWAVSATSVAVLMLRGNEPGALPLALFVGAYTVAAYRSARQVVVAAGLMGALLVLLYLTDPPNFEAGDLVSSVAAFATALLIGWTMQSRRRRIEAFEGEQHEAALRAAADERLRIAQELHDVVAHSLGVIAVQAGVGMKVIDTDLAQARRSFEHISRTSRSSLAEIRRLLGMVRDPEGTPTYAPAPGLDDVPRLADEISGAGLAVDLEVEGDLGDVPPGVGRAAYRIVQEALTNSLRHAAARRATVRLDATSGGLRIEVTDDGRGAAGRGPAGRDGRPERHGRPGQGHGIVGMRERVATYGGSLDVGPGPTGGFRVAALLPYEGGDGPVIRVAVADDQALVRGGFSVLLGTAADIDVVGEAADGAAAIDLVARQHPDVVLMDIRMPVMDGVEATRRITADDRLASTRVLILTTFDLDEYVFEALRAGASGFLLKDTLPDDLLAAVRVVAEGDALLAPRVTRRLVEEFVRREAPPSTRPRPELASLTAREVEVLAAVARGLSNAEIAASLFMSHATAKTHVSRLLAKLGARDRAQLVMLAYEAGVVAPGGGCVTAPGRMGMG